MNSVDNKIVEMQFDNKQFNSGITESISALDKLKESISFEGSGDGLEKLQKSVEKFNVNPMLDGFGDILGSINVMDIALGNMIANFATRWVDNVVGLVKSTVGELTLGQISPGQAKYEDKTRSVKTMMNATGDSLEFVNEEMAKLNWFTDETSYNFTDMASNIAKFTSQGKGLEESLAAMEGVATWAARAGQTSTEASRAMYNIAQAMGAGAMKLQDWKSIENANMATKEFKELAIDIGYAMGKIEEGAEVTAETFSTTLASGWFDSDVLMAALDVYGGFAATMGDWGRATGLSASNMMSLVDAYLKAEDKQKVLVEGSQEYEVELETLSKLVTQLASDEYSLGREAFRAAQEYTTFSDVIDATKDAVSTSWMNIFETVLGDYEEAREVWSAVGDEFYTIFGEPVANLSELLADWKGLEVDKEGVSQTRLRLLEGIASAYQTLASAVEAVANGFRRVFPAMDAEKLAGITDGFAEFLSSLEISDKTLLNIQKTAAGFASVVKVVLAVLKNVAGVALNLVKAFSPLATVVFSITGYIGEFIFDIVNLVQRTQVVSKTFNGIIGVITRFGDAILYIVSKTLGLDIVLPTIHGIAEFLDASKLKPAVKVLQDVGRVIGDFFAPAFEAISNYISTLDERLDNFKATAVEKLQPFAEGISELKDRIGELVEKFVSFKDEKVAEFVDRFAAFQKTIDAFKTSKVEAISEALGKLSSSFNDKKTAVLNAFAKAVEVIGNALKTVVSYVSPLVKTLWDIVLNVAAAIKEFFASLSPEGTGTLVGSAGIITVLALINSAIGKMKSSGIESIVKKFKTFFKDLGELMESIGHNEDASAVKEIAVSVAILAGSMFLLSLIDTDKIGQGVGALSLILGELIGALALYNKIGQTSSDSVKVGAALVLMAISITLISSALSRLVDADVGALAVAATAVGGLLLAIGKLMQSLTGKDADPAKLSATATGIVMLSVAILIVSKALENIATVPSENLLGATAALAAIFFMLHEFLKHFDAQQFTEFSKSMVFTFLAAAILTLSKAVKKLGDMDPDQLSQGLKATGLILAGFVAFFKMVQDTGMNASAGAGLMGVAAAINMLVVAVTAFGLLPFKTLVQGGAAVGTLLLMLGLFTKFSKDMGVGTGVAIVALAIAINALVPAITLLGLLPLKVIGVGLAAIFGAFVVVAAGAKLIEKCGGTILTFAVSLALVSSAVFVAALALPLLASGIVAFATAIAGSAAVLTAAVVAIGTAIVGGIVGIAGVLVAGIISLVSKLLEGVIGLIDAIIPRVPEIVTKFFELIDALLIAITDGIDTIVINLVTLIATILVSLGEALIANQEQIKEGLINIIIAIINIAGGLLEWFLIDVIWNQIILGFFKTILPGIGDFLGEVGDGIASIFMAIGEFFAGLVGSIASWIGERASDILDTGKDILTGIATGFIESANLIKEKVKEIVDKIKGWFKDKVDKFHQVGEDIISGLTGGIADSINNIKTNVTNAASAIYEGFCNFFHIKSPSRLMREVGGYIDEGLAQGIEKYSYLSENSAQSMASDTYSAITDAIAGIDSAFDDDAIHPVISPVLDLNNISNGVNQIDGIFSRQQALSASIVADAESNSDSLDELISIGRAILGAVREGGNVYLNEDTLVGRINRRLGRA